MADSAEEASNSGGAKSQAASEAVPYLLTSAHSSAAPLLKLCRDLLTYCIYFCS
jgi:hypothetical protein